MYSTMIVAYFLDIFVLYSEVVKSISLSTRSAIVILGIAELQALRQEPRSETRMQHEKTRKRVDLSRKQGQNRHL